MQYFIVISHMWATSKNQTNKNQNAYKLTIDKKQTIGLR